jgi:hypothetical protein
VLQHTASRLMCAAGRDALNNVRDHGGRNLGDRQRAKRRQDVSHECPFRLRIVDAGPLSRLS